MIPLDPERLLDGYRAVEACAEAMANAAECRDWEAYEAALAIARDAIDAMPKMRDEDFERAGVGVRRSRMRILTRILAHDARIREALEPIDPSVEFWMRREPFSAPPMPRR